MLAEGDFHIVSEAPHALCYVRQNEKGCLMVGANNGSEDFALTLPRSATELLSGKRVRRGRVILREGDVFIWRL